MNNELKEFVKYKYGNDKFWFADFVNEPYNRARIGKDFDLINYLNGKHQVLNREDFTYKDKKFISKKLILNLAKTIINFHTTYIVGNPVSLTGTEELINKVNNIYRYGGFNKTDFNIANKLVKFGNAYEYIYKEGNKIKSKLIDTDTGYPVYNDNQDYIAFVQYWTTIDGIDYYYIYTEDNIEYWSNIGGDMHLIDTYNNTSHSLPIVYKYVNDYDYRYGRGLLEDILPILNELEDIFSKMGDAIYRLSLNPLLVSTGQALENSGVSKDVTGSCINLDNGSTVEYTECTMDYNTIKLYIDKLENYLNMVGYLPTVLGGSGNIANVSEVSLKLLYQLADVYAMVTEQVLREGMNDRLNIIRELIKDNKEDDYINVTFNYSRPQNAQELLNNIKVQSDMNAISIQSIIEKSPITTDTAMELERLKGSNDDTKESNEDTKIDK